MTGHTWHRAAACPAGGQCVEVRHTTACTDLGILHPDCDNDEHPKVPAVAVRDSKQPGQHALVFTLDEWAVFLAGVRRGEFDQPNADIGSDQTVTTTQAATILGVSHPTVARFCDEGRLPYAQPGKHRILRLADVLEFKADTTHGGDQ